VSYCVVLWGILCLFVCICVYSVCICVYLWGCVNMYVFARPKLRYSSASRMSYLLRCVIRGVQNGGVCIWGCVYMCLFVCICVYMCPIVCICVYMCVNMYVFVSNCVYLCVNVCEFYGFLWISVECMIFYRIHPFEAVGFLYCEFFFVFEFFLIFHCMYVFFLILIWFSLIFSLNEWFFLWIFLLNEWMNDLNCFWGCENEWKYVFFEVVSKCLKIGENRVFWDPRDLMNFIEFSIDCDFYGFLWIFLNDFFFWMIFFFLFCFLIEEFFSMDDWMNDWSCWWWCSVGMMMNECM